MDHLPRFICLFLSLAPLLVVPLSFDLVSASAHPTPTVGLHCGRALAQWNAVAVADLSLTLLSVRPSTAPPTSTPTTGGVVLVEVAVENGRAQPVPVKAKDFILTNCRNDTAPALSRAQGPNVQPLAFTSAMDEQATNVARANAAACQTLPMLIGQSVPSHGRLKGWSAFPSWTGAQPRSLDYLIFGAGTVIQAMIHCSLVDANPAMATPSSGNTAACAADVAAPVAASPAAS